MTIRALGLEALMEAQRKISGLLALRTTAWEEEAAAQMSEAAAAQQDWRSRRIRVPARRVRRPQHPEQFLRAPWKAKEH
jgi:hypothetical protein